MKQFNITERTKIKRLPERASYDKDTVYKILDETFICHIAFLIGGKVNIIPTIFGRKDDMIFIHGSKNSRMLKSFVSGEDICFSVTIADGIVLARSAFHHSVNYRSVVIYGKPEEITGEDGKIKALEIIMRHLMPGRWEEVRNPSSKELNITSVFSLKIDEASAKIRGGPATDDKEDLGLNVWAGVLPLKTVAGEPVGNPDMKQNIALPGYLRRYKK